MAFCCRTAVKTATVVVVCGRYREGGERDRRAEGPGPAPGVRNAAGCSGRRFGPEIDLSRVGVDLYWNVDLRTAFEMREDPAPGIDVGQSSDDLAELRALLRRPADDVPVLWHDLQHLAGALRLLAYLDLPSSGADES